MAIPISTCIICKNEAQRIGGALDSVAWCADIVVVDSGSTDATREIAAAHKSRPRVIEQAWLGFSGQRRFAVEQCKNPWVLMLDADEECSPELAREIAELTDERAKNIGIFHMPRHNYVAGRYVRSWSPDEQSRLIHRERVEWDPRPLPEIRRVKTGFGEGRLQGALLHGRLTPFSLTEVNDAAKMAAYAELLARHMHEQGKRASYLNLLFRPWATFIKFYFIKGGFLDGRFGLVTSYRATIGVMLKYSVLYALQELEPGEKKDGE